MRKFVVILSRLYFVSGLLLILGTATLAVRLIWEQTVLSWERGPQMVGFALAHGSGPYYLIFLPLLLVPWLGISIIWLVGFVIKKRKLSKLFVVSICVAGPLLFTLRLPYTFWQRMFAGRIAAGPYAGEFFTGTAAEGDIATIKAFVAHGIPVDIRNRSGATGLHGAAVEGKIEMIAFLISKGADVNATDRSGDSPMEDAISMNHPEAAKYLADHGGKRIQGTEGQHNKAAEDIVREDMEKLDVESPRRSSGPSREETETHPK